MKRSEIRGSAKDFDSAVGLAKRSVPAVTPKKTRAWRYAPFARPTPAEFERGKRWLMADAVQRRDDLLAQKAAGKVLVGGDRTLDEEIKRAKSSITEIEMMMAQSKIDRSRV